MRIFISLLFCMILSMGSFQAKADLTDAVGALFQANESQLSPFEEFAHHLNQTVDTAFTSAKGIFSTSLGTAEKNASYIINDHILRTGLVLLISFLALFLLRHFAHSFMKHRPNLSETDQVILEIIPWLGFWALSMFLCEAINLAPVPRHALGTCLTLIAIGFGLRQVSMVVYHLHHNILHQRYHETFKRLAPAFVYYGVTALIALGLLLILGIGGTFIIAWLAKHPIEPNSPHALMMIDVAWYFYLLCFSCLILALQHHHVKKLKKAEVSSLTISLDQFHTVGYLCLFLSFSSWLAAEAGWVDPISYKLMLVLTLILLAVLFLQSAIKIIHYATDTLMSWLLSENAKLMLDYVFILRVLGYTIYLFIIITVLAYALDLNFYFAKLINAGNYIIEKGLALTLVIGSVILIHKVLNKITHRIVESQVHLKRAQRASSRLFTFLLLFRNLVPTLLWVPAIIVILLMFGVDSKYILYVFLLILAAFVFISQNMLQDIIKGFVLIAEDIISIGDIITINHVTGTVEHLTFQSVSIRDYAGLVHTFSFSTITALAHHEWEYSYAVCEIAIHYEENLDKAIEIMMKIAKNLQKDPKFQNKILGDMETPGVDNIKEDAVTIKGRIKTKAGTQSDIQKEYYKQLLHSFKKARISLPCPKRISHILSK